MNPSENNGDKLTPRTTFFTPATLFALLIFIGNYPGKLRRNFWAGIRTPWTFARKSVPQRLLFTDRQARNSYQSGAAGLCSLSF